MLVRRLARRESIAVFLSSLWLWHYLHSSHSTIPVGGAPSRRGDRKQTTTAKSFAPRSRNAARTLLQVVAFMKLRNAMAWHCLHSNHSTIPVGGAPSRRSDRKQTARNQGWFGAGQRQVLKAKLHPSADTRLYASPVPLSTDWPRYSAQHPAHPLLGAEHGRENHLAKSIDQHF